MSCCRSLKRKSLRSGLSVNVQIRRLSGGQRLTGVYVYPYLKAVIEEEECDMFTPVARLVSQSDCFYSINQTAMGGEQVGLQRKVQPSKRVQ